MHIPQRRINDSADYKVSFPCGCTVTFLGSCFHRTSRMMACTRHDGRDQFAERTALVQDAKRTLAVAKRAQPPR